MRHSFVFLTMAKHICITIRVCTTQFIGKRLRGGLELHLLHCRI